VKAGAKVIISARREEKLHELAAECRAHGYEPFVQPLDVTDSEKLAATVDNIVHKFGRIDSVVLNAGRSQRAIAVETSLDETKQLLDLNFISYVALTKQVLPHMIKQWAAGSGEFPVGAYCHSHRIELLRNQICSGKYISSFSNRAFVTV
jgi:dehydrogenase/reductase SDR family protein 7B